MPLSSLPLAEVDAFTAQVFPPAVGTAVDAEDVQAGEQTLTNRTRFLLNHGRFIGSTSFANDTGGTNASLYSVTSTSYVTQVALNSPTVQIGDLLVFDFSGSLETNEPAGNTATVQLNIKQPDATLANPLGSTLLFLAQTFAIAYPFTLNQIVTATQAGVYQLELNVRSQSAAATKLMFSVMARILQFRP